MIRYLLVGIGAVLSAPFVASAHVKWFVAEEEITPIPWTTLWTTEWVVYAAIAFIIALLIARYLNNHLRVISSVRRYATTYREAIGRIAEVFFGLFCIVTPLAVGTVLLPDITINEIPSYILWLQWCLGALFITGMYVRGTAVVTAVLMGGLSIHAGGIAFLENIVVVGLLYYFYKRRTPAAHDHALRMLRITTGISLVTLALSEKLLAPYLSVAFLETYQWNFLGALIPSITNNLFILIVGTVEIVFGTLYIKGYVTRLTTLGLAVLLVVSATTMYLTNGNWEAGHIAIYAVAIVLGLLGSGKTSRE